MPNVYRLKPEKEATDFVDLGRISNAIDHAKHGLIAAQEADGHWCFALEADCTIPAEYILMMHFVDEIDVNLEQKLAIYLRRHQNEEGGWPLFHAGESDISCTVKAYYALKLTGDSIDAPHMKKACDLILKMGGAAKANVFTRITLAFFEQIPWRGVPLMPVELILLPKFFPFHISKISYWSRTVMIPLLILCSLKAKAANPKKIQVREIFLNDPFQETEYFTVRSNLNKCFLLLNEFGRKIEWIIPKFIRNYAIRQAIAWIKERQNGEHGLGAIFPAMVNAFQAFKTLNRAEDTFCINQARNALKKLILYQDDYAYCQPCFSPVWDTSLALLALQEESLGQITTTHYEACQWLKSRQLTNEKGDWQVNRPTLLGGGFAFQYENSYYPDLDDTAVVAIALFQGNDHNLYDDVISRAANWLAGMQSQGGGFASFDVDNTHYYLNEIPFADHGALLDPPTADVSARCAMLFGVLQQNSYHPNLISCIDYLLKSQEKNGSWFGRWGTNYIYGTWSVLVALEKVGFPANHPAIRKAVQWLKSIQNPDGGFGESNASYFHSGGEVVPHPSTSFQTAWAILGLLAAGEEHSNTVQRGVQYLVDTQKKNGFWHEPYFTAPGFPRVFYLKYHGYSKYFPLWALARFRNKIQR